jgi:prepilin-type N-terminal cleavage/methylation domain-containing protein
MPARCFTPSCLKIRLAFTLMETMLAISILGIGVSAVVQLLAKGTSVNIDAVDTSVALNLANSIHELTYNLHFVDPAQPTHWGPESGETLAQYSPYCTANSLTVQCVSVTKLLSVGVWVVEDLGAGYAIFSFLYGSGRCGIDGSFGSGG